MACAESDSDVRPRRHVTHGGFYPAARLAIRRHVALGIWPGAAGPVRGYPASKPSICNAVIMLSRPNSVTNHGTPPAKNVSLSIGLRRTRRSRSDRARRRWRTKLSLEIFVTECSHASASWCRARCEVPDVEAFDRFRFDRAAVGRFSDHERNMQLLGFFRLQPYMEPGARSLGPVDGGREMNRETPIKVVLSIVEKRPDAVSPHRCLHVS